MQEPIANSFIHMEVNCQCQNCVLKNLIFTHIPEKDANILCGVRKEKKFKKGDVIVEQGAPISNFFYVKSGLVKLSKLSDQKRNYIITIAKPHDYISLLTVFHEKEYAYSMTALEYTEICVFPLNLIIDLTLKHGSFALGIIKKASKTSDAIIDKFIKHNSRNLRGRIAMTLLDFSLNIYKSHIFELPISRKEIAELIGMTTENVIRILSEFRKENILRINGKEIEILDYDRLKMIFTHG